MKKHKKINLSFAISLIIALLICALITMFSLKDIQHSSYLERAKSINLVMSKIGEHLNIAFDSKWGRAHVLTARIERRKAATVDELIEELNDIYMETGADFRVVDDSGIAYYPNGMQEYWKDYSEVRDEGEMFILSPLQFGLTDENFMKYIMPLKEPLKIGDSKIIYTILTEPLSALSKNFDTSNYGEDCLSFIIDKRGTFIYENGSGDPMADSYNFLAYVEKTVTFLYGESFEKFKENIENGIDKTVLVEYNGSFYYLSHFDLDIDNWASVMLVPEKNTQAGDRSFTQKLLGNIAIVFETAFFLFIIGFIYMWKKTVTKQRLAAEAERRSNEAKTNFLSSMSHDIRTPMNAIIGMTEIALNSKKDIPKSVLENLEKIRLSSTHLVMLINDILDISKIESGRMSLNIAEFSATETIKTLSNLTRPLAKDKNITLSIHTNNYRQEHLIGDELRASQICINLVTNAIKYTPSGGSVALDFKQEFPEDMPNKVHITFSVRDNGIGMSEEFQKVMYQAFSRATDSRVSKVEGSGLGLPICHEMVQMMGGTLECESEQGKGTAFTVSVVLEKGRPDEVYELPNMRVLVIDSDDVSTNELKSIFKRLNIEADVVNDFSTLPDILNRNNSYRLAFVELGVPNNSGIGIVKTLRERFGEDFPIVLTDILDMGEHLDRVNLTDVTVTMNKPYFYRDVYQTIFNVIKETKADGSPNDKDEKQIIAGMKVLVAEDNDLNWEILYEILKINGIKAKRAENGKICVDELNNSKHGEYAAVLMDVRMPVMDGLKATKLIRKSKKEWLRKIPIIAMTADAFAEDIHHCMEAGMDAHLAKPINFNKLLAVLLDIKKKPHF